MTALFPGPLLDALAAALYRAAIEHGDRTVTRSELLATVGRLVRALADAGLGPGRGVAMHTAVTPEAFAAHLAAHALGCRVVGVRPGWTEGSSAGSWPGASTPWSSTRPRGPAPAAGR